MKKTKILNEADIDGIDELVYNPVTGPKGNVGFGYDRGIKVKNISWANHDNHLHIGFTKREVAMEVIDKAIELGLKVGENSYPGNKKTPKTGHANNSFHYIEFAGEPKVSGGADITGKQDKIEELIRWTIEKYGKGPFEYKVDKLTSEGDEISISEEKIKKIISQLEGLKNETIKKPTKRIDLPQGIKNVLSKLENDYNVKIEDINIENEFNQENQYYQDNLKEDSEAKKNINKMIEKLKEKFPDLKQEIKIVSGYRSYEEQVGVFGTQIKRDGGVSQRQKNVTLPGFSQHHTGKAFDIISVDPDWWKSHPEVENWVKENSKDFGFKVSYPTKGVLRNPEPWHLFYIGDFSKNISSDEEDLKLKELGKQVNLEIKKNVGKGKNFNLTKYENLKTNTNIKWAVYNINTNNLIAQNNGNQNIYGASVSKVVVAAVALVNNNGNLSDPNLQKMMKLLIESDNSVWNDIQSLAGGPTKVNEWAESMGYNMKPSRNINQINAVGMCKFWSDTYNNKYEGSNTILKITNSVQTSSNKSLPYLPQDVFVGGKTGTFFQESSKIFYNHDSVWIKGNNGVFSITILSDGSISFDDLGQMFGGLYYEYCTQ